MLALTIDTASEYAGLALSEDGDLVAELTWRTHQNHSKELLPNLEVLLGRTGRSKYQIAALIVCLGPGSYAGLRVGLSTAKGLAYSLGARLVGVGRLAADAAPFAIAGGAPVYAVHVAGRADLAWAVYEGEGDSIREVVAPHLTPREAFIDRLGPGVIVCGELDDGLRTAVEATGAAVAMPMPPRVTSLARLGWQRLAAGNVDNADALVPLYLREPAIGPQPPR